MSNTKKMSKRDYFEQIKKNYALTPNEIEFINHEIELLDRKNIADKKPTATQIANKGIAEGILAKMTANPTVAYTITDLLKTVPECADLTNQKVSAIVRQLVADSKVVRIEDKRKTYFKIAQ